MQRLWSQVERITGYKLYNTINYDNNIKVFIDNLTYQEDLISIIKCEENINYKSKAGLRYEVASFCMKRHVMIM